MKQERSRMLVLVTDPSPPLSLPHIDPYHSNNVSHEGGVITDVVNL